MLFPKLMDTVNQPMHAQCYVRTAKHVSQPYPICSLCTTSHLIHATILDISMQIRCSIGLCAALLLYLQASYELNDHLLSFMVMHLQVNTMNTDRPLEAII